MSEDVDVPNRKKRDPILMIGTIVLALAFVVVISGYAYGEFIANDNDVSAKYGDKVKVNYVGSYYDWYQDANGNPSADAVVFDTSLWSVANNDGIEKSYEFSKKAEDRYTEFNVTIGSGGALADFENALIGKKPGDTVRIMIPDAYGALKASNIKQWTDLSGMEFDRVQMMSADEYKLTFGVTTVYPGMYANLQHPYGWTCDATIVSGGYIYVTHNVAAGDDFSSADGSIEVTVDDHPSESSKFIVDFTFGGYDNWQDDIPMVKFIYGASTYYVTGVDTVAGTFKTKNTTEIIGQDLYFVITFVGYQ